MIVLFLSNSSSGLYLFRKEIIETLIKKYYKVWISTPLDGFHDELESLGADMVENLVLDRRGTNPIRDYQLYKYYVSLIKKIKPDIVFTYTIKPNVYGGIACGLRGIPYVANVTGLGTSIQNAGLLQAVAMNMYRIGLKNAQKVYFQNNDNKEYLLNHKVVRADRIDVLPGSGVNLEQHCYEKYPESDEYLVFTTIGRIMKDKGIDELLYAAEIIKTKYSNVEFRLIGEFDEDYQETVERLAKENIINYLGIQNNIHKFISESHAIIHASYHEGMSNVLLEAASTGRPVIATDVPGCIDTFEPGVTGIAFKPKNSQALVKAIEEFISMPNDKRKTMGLAGRKKMESEFSRSIVINHYLEEIESIKGVSGNGPL